MLRQHDSTIDNAETTSNDHNTEYDSLSSSSSSIIDEDIDFDLVYSMHTFEATVEGQASVEKGDSLTLLDDSNIYWWLVKLTKNGKTGYIPAEIIETPYEKLARLNKNRNLNLAQKGGEGVEGVEVINWFEGVNEDEIDEGGEGEKEIDKTNYGHEDGHDCQDESKIAVKSENQIPVPEENMSNSPHIETTTSPSTLKDKFISAFSTTTIGNSSKIETENDVNKQVVDPSTSHLLSPEVAQQNIQLSNNLQYNRQKNGGNIAPNKNKSKRKPAGIPIKQTVNNNNVSPANPNDSVPPLLDVSNDQTQAIKSNLSPTLGNDFMDFTDDDDVEKVNKKSNKTALRESNRSTVLKVTEGKKAQKKEKETTSRKIKNMFMFKKMPSKKKDDDSTVPINQSTTAADLIKQAISRFKIDKGKNWENYYITIKLANGEELKLMPHDHLLEIHQTLNSLSTASLSTTKRSSTSFSNTSVHPTVENLEGDEKSVDVTFYLNKKSVDRNNSRISSICDKKQRLRLRVLIYADDLPAHLRFKSPPSTPPPSQIPRKSKSVPKHLIEKTGRRRSHENGKPREKHLIVDGLATVYDVISKSMSKFGIIDGVVDDGEYIGRNDIDEVPRYKLMLSSEGNEKLLHPKTEILSVYQTPPNLIRLSVDSLDSNSSLVQNYLPDEPTFVLRLSKPENCVDIVTSDGAIRSSRIFDESKVRYSFILTDGEEMDISDIIEDVMGFDKKNLNRRSTQDVDVLVKIADGAQNNDNDNISCQSLNKIDLVIEKVKPTINQTIESENKDIIVDLVHKAKTPSKISRSSSVSSANDFGLEELLMLARGVNKLELKERRKSDWYLNEDPHKVLDQLKSIEIKDKIKDIFADITQELDKMDQDLDKLLADTIRIF
nr:5676_t:CDS:10 [Entrophospora candida]